MVLVGHSSTTWGRSGNAKDNLCHSNVKYSHINWKNACLVKNYSLLKRLKIKIKHLVKSSFRYYIKTLARVYLTTLFLWQLSTPGAGDPESALASAKEFFSIRKWSSVQSIRDAAAPLRKHFHFRVKREYYMYICCGTQTIAVTVFAFI